MPRTKISEFSATAGSNTDIDGINIAEGCSPSGINDAIRELMAQLKDFQAGTAGDSFNGPVGTTTPAAGAFTNLSASGTFALTGDQVQISEGGTGQTTANAAFNALAPSQTSNAGKYLKTDGTNTSWDALDISTADITGTLPVANGGTGVTSSTGTGSVVLSASPTFTGTVNAAALTLSGAATLNGGTANGIAYLNGSKVLTTGSALSFDGANLQVGGNSQPIIRAVSSSTNNATARLFTDGDTVYMGSLNTSTTGSSVPVVFQIGGTEQARLTSTGLGIGTSSPSFKLDVQDSNANIAQFTSSGASTSLRINNTNANAWGSNIGIFTGGTAAGYFGTIGSLLGSTAQDLAVYATAGNGFRVYTNGNNLRATFDSSGNLGLGVTPSAWSGSYTAMQIRSLSLFGSTSNSEASIGGNVFVNTSGQYAYKSSTVASLYQQVNGTHAWFTAGSGTAGNTISFTQAMTLDASGNLGVGTTSPDVFSRGYGRVLGVSSASSAGIEVNAATGNTATFDLGVNGTRYAYFNATASDSFLSTAAANPLLLGTNNTERARITSGGDLLVGKTSFGGTATGIDLGANGFVGSYSPDTTNATSTFAAYSNGASAYRFYVGWGGTVYATNTTITAISDRRLKENIQDIDVGLDAVMALKPRKFDWKAGKGKDKKGDRGWIAQEFEQVFPEMIDTWRDPAPEGEEPYKAVNADLIPVLVKAIQEQQAIITDLRARVAQLETK